MGRLSEEVFNESCCDGGEVCQDSAQPCGCDPKINYTSPFCETHSRKVEGGNGSVTPTKSVGIGGAPTRASKLPEDPEKRKQFPVASGVLDYFPDALVVIANVSWQGNEQHNPGQPLHWARSKSSDEADTMIRHFLQRGSLDKDGIRHTAKMAWRALALLQKELENENKN